MDEQGSDACRRFFDDADTVVTSRLLYVEAAAALAQGRRLRRLSEDDFRRCRHTMDVLWEQFDVVEVDQEMVARAAGLVDQLALRGYDAVHCAAAVQVADDELVAASGDRRLLDAWRLLGVDTFDVTVV